MSLKSSKMLISKLLSRYGIFYFALLILLSLWIYQKNLPVAIVSPQLSASNKLQCVSYAPYYGKDQTPFIIGMQISPAQIDADLKLLADITDCVRTYSVGQGMDYVPEAAAKLGLKVYLGAWIGWTDADNVGEVNLAAERANAYPDTVKALIIGNEVFLRQEQNEVAMQRYIGLARKQTKTPITYADVWEFWNKHKKMEQHVDFITVHVLPYWEDNPVAINQAVKHASNVMTLLATNFKKPILIGETGWPSVGRQRDESEPSLVNQARYVREFLQMAHEKNWQYNVIEAIDQPWKRVLEGTVGGYWGIFSSDLQSKFSLTAPVSERHDGKTPFYFALIGTLLFVGLVLRPNTKLRPNINLEADTAPTIKQPLNAVIGFAALGGLAGLTALLQYEYLVAACRDYIEWFALGGVALLGWLGIFLQPWFIGRYSDHENKITLFVLTSLLLAAITTSALILLDGRYRDYPNMLFALPALALSIGLICMNGLPKVPWRTHYWLCSVGIILSALCLAIEPQNHAAMAWLAINLLLAFANWPKSSNPKH